MNYAVTNRRTATAKDEWTPITLRYHVYSTVAMENWCKEHESDGEYFCLLIIGNKPKETWYFELEKDALLFALTWGA